MRHNQSLGNLVSWADVDEEDDLGIGLGVVVSKDAVSGIFGAGLDGSGSTSSTIGKSSTVVKGFEFTQPVTMPPR